MTTLDPRSPYTDAELDVFYPKSLQLEQVQVILRHGERTPVSARFQNAGLAEHWPYCRVANRLARSVMNADGWDTFTYRRRLETFGLNDLPTIAKGPYNEMNAVCQPGELTDQGRLSTLKLGQRLRHLYIDQLRFMPDLLANPDMFYLRATPIPRALESVQQAFVGFYPSSKRNPTSLLPTIISRASQDETLFPNESACKRFAQLAAAFAERASQRWNDTPEMEYLNKKLGKWMPERSPRVKVDSHPRLSGIMDTVNSTLAHGPETRLPSEFYEPKVREIIDKIGVEEWFAGYMESQEYRMLGSGALVGDMVTRMVGHVEKSTADGSGEVGAVGGESNETIRFALSGAHDTTLAGILASLGAFKGEQWPPYTSHIALELFKATSTPSTTTTTTPPPPPPTKPWWTALFGPNQLPTPGTITRTPIPQLTPAQLSRLNSYYVRIRYNDRSVTVPGCRPYGKHLEGDETFCTLAAFKEIADKFTPRDWKAACGSNLEKARLPEGVEEAGY